MEENVKLGKLEDEIIDLITNLVMKMEKTSNEKFKDGIKKFLVKKLKIEIQKGNNELYNKWCV